MEYIPPITLAVDVDLDDHTRKFIVPEPMYQCAPAQAVFRLASPSLHKRFFVARLAPLNIHWDLQAPRFFGQSTPVQGLPQEWIIWVPVLREIHYETQESGSEGKWVVGQTCLVSFHDSPLRLRRGEVPSPESIEEFWRDNTAIVYSPSTEPYCYAFFDAGTSGDEITSLAQCYYHQPSGLGLAMFAEGDCWLLGLQTGSQNLQEDVHPIYARGEWIEEENAREGAAASDDRPTLLELSNEAFTAKVEARLGDPRAELRYTMEFYQTDEEQRCREVLQCSSQVRRLVQKKYEVEFLLAMSSGDELAGYISVRCTPWVDQPLRAETSLKIFNMCRWLTVPPGLRQRCSAICCQLEATLPLCAPTRDDSPESLRQKVRYNWAERFSFEVKEGSAHEVAARLDSLQEEIAKLEAEIAATAG